MRDILVSAIVFGSLPFILRRPHIGILMWCWLSYMNPHRLTYGWARYFSFAEIVAILTLFSVFVSKENWRIPLTPLTVVWFVFIAWMGLTTYMALIPELAQAEYLRIGKIQLTTFLTIMVINSKQRLNMLLTVIVFSIAFFGIKGGIFTLVRGGDNRVWGPPGGFIEDNNALALGLLMIAPLMNYLRTQAQQVWARRALLAAMILTALAALGTYSRGAMVAGAVVVLFFWFKSKKKLLVAVALAVILPALIQFMPEQWSKRLDTMFQGYDASGRAWSEATGFAMPIESRDRLHFWPIDTSAVGRVNAWNYSINVANERVTGAGLESWKDPTFALYAPVPEDVHSAHSIYFSVLGDHGWIGLFLYVLIGLMAYRTAGNVARNAKAEEVKWLADLCRMVQVALIAYATGGAFLSLSYFDLYWHWVAIVVIAQGLLARHNAAQELARRPAAAPRRFSGMENIETGDQLVSRQRAK
jgi:putative inorganic carbon (hco3(-)) transporter